MDLAFQFIKKQGGITSEQNYPYKAADGRCDTRKVKFVALNCKATNLIA
mgnify:CR=1 FL=1